MGKLKERIKQKYAYVSEFATEIGVSSSAVGSWDAGRSKPEIERLPEISRKLGISCEELLKLLGIE